MSEWLRELNARVERVTSVRPPWRLATTGCVRLFWRQPAGRDGQSFAASFHHGDRDSDGAALGTLDPGIPESVVQLARPVIAQWLAQTPARLKDTWALVEDVCVLLVSPEDGQALCAYGRAALLYTPTRGEPWMLAVPDANGKFRRFLIVIPVPQEFRSKAQFEEWFKAALRHELEHVFQITARQREPVNSWRPFSEQGAVRREWDGTSPNSAALDYAHAFRTRLPLGLDAPYYNDGYHLHPFCEWVDLTAPGLLDTLWLRAGSDPQHCWSQPLPLLDQMLREFGCNSLADVWTNFCIALPFPGQLASLENLRQASGAAVLESFVVDLAADAPANSRRFRLPYVAALSCHFAVVHSHPKRSGTLTATLDPDSCPEPVDLRIRHATLNATLGQSSLWEEIPVESGQTVPFVFPPGSADVCHWFAFVFASLPLNGLTRNREPKSRDDFYQADGILAVELHLSADVTAPR